MDCSAPLVPPEKQHLLSPQVRNSRDEGCVQSLQHHFDGGCLLAALLVRCKTAIPIAEAGLGTRPRCPPQKIMTGLKKVCSSGVNIMRRAMLTTSCIIDQGLWPAESLRRMSPLPLSKSAGDNSLGGVPGRSIGR